MFRCRFSVLIALSICLGSFVCHAGEPPNLSAGIEQLGGEPGEKSVEDAYNHVRETIAAYLKAGATIKFDEPQFVALFGQYTLPVKSVQNVEVKGIIKLRAKELCPHHDENQFIVSLLVTDQDGKTVEIGRSLQFASKVDLKKSVVYAKKHKQPVPKKRTWQMAKTTIVADSYAVNVAKINQLRAK